MVLQSQEINRSRGGCRSSYRSTTSSRRKSRAFVLSGGCCPVCHPNGCHLLVEWCSSIQDQPELPGFVPFGREIGGLMLTISGLRNFYFLPHFHDMRCGYSRIMEVIRMSYHRNPYKGDVFFFMSKNERSVRMLMYDKHSFNVHTCTFSKGYRFMKIRFEEYFL